MDPKKVAVLVRHNQPEALRVAGGLTLADHDVSVFVLDQPLADSEAVAEQLEVLEFAEVEPISAIPGDDSGSGHVDLEQLANDLPGYDAVLTL